MSTSILKYKQRDSKPHIFVERWGVNCIELQHGTIDYDQEEKIEDSKVNKRIAELKSFTNRKYHSFKIVT
tara:strand:- start:4933 stop:5142 length:210 start_codon:yes stop_codon:yes gene_type:complete